MWARQKGENKMLNNSNKEIKSMTQKEILRQQLELLAERSKECLDEDLPKLTEAMISVFEVLVTY